MRFWLVLVHSSHVYGASVLWQIVQMLRKSGQSQIDHLAPNQLRKTLLYLNSWSQKRHTMHQIVRFSHQFPTKVASYWQCTSIFTSSVLSNPKLEIRYAKTSYKALKWIKMQVHHNKSYTCKTRRLIPQPYPVCNNTEECLVHTACMWMHLLISPRCGGSSLFLILLCYVMSCGDSCHVMLCGDFSSFHTRTRTHTHACIYPHLNHFSTLLKVSLQLCIIYRTFTTL